MSAPGTEADAGAVSGAGANQQAPAATSAGHDSGLGGKCRVPMWIMGSPAGFCDAPAFGPQYPQALRWADRLPYCVGPCCPAHGGPKAGEPIVFRDGCTDQGYPMWCAVMPDFEDLQASPAGFDGDPRRALENLRAAVAKASGSEPDNKRGNGSSAQEPNDGNVLNNKAIPQ